MGTGRALRIGVALVAVALLCACGGQQQEGAAVAPGGSEVTVVLPPPAPPAEGQPVSPTTGAAGAERQGPVTGQQAAWAGVLRRVGFPCERITSVREAGGGYRVDCAGGGPYRATRRDGRIKFSRWREA